MRTKTNSYTHGFKPRGTIAEELDRPHGSSKPGSDSSVAQSESALKHIPAPALEPQPGDPDFEPIPPSEEDAWRLAANFTREDVVRSRLEEIGEESQLPPEEWDDHIA